MNDDEIARKKLSALLLICFDALDTYGKEPEQLANVVKTFELVLGRFRFDQIERAFAVYLERNTQMPKPADIVNIIEPPAAKRKWCGATFLDIKRRMREGQFITKDERQYCDDYISQATNPASDYSIEAIDYMKRAQLEDKNYWSMN